MAQNNENDNKKQQRVFYFEPNDTSIAKDINGEDVALMPHWEDMCIAMRLTADIFPREKYCINSLNDTNPNMITQRTVSWISYVGNGNNRNASSSEIINAGVKMGENNYLTTYYTEISADKYIENELIEGLGVTNVSIAFESWVMPTIQYTLLMYTVQPYGGERKPYTITAK